MVMTDVLFVFPQLFCKLISFRFIYSFVWFHHRDQTQGLVLKRNRSTLRLKTHPPVLFMHLLLTLETGYHVTQASL